ncbi:MAG: ester cyclase [Chitinophagales bacterium]
MKQLLVFIAGLACICSCNTASEPATTTNTVDSAAMAKEAMLAKNKATALASVQGFNSHNVDDILKDAAAIVTDYGDGSGKSMSNMDSLRANLKAFITAFPDLKVETSVVLAEGNHVAIFEEWSGTFKADIMGMKATGKSFKLKDVDLLTFNDAGKITEHRSVQSNQTLFSQVMKKK